jgi:hypothetical protein
MPARAGLAAETPPETMAVLGAVADPELRDLAAYARLLLGTGRKPPPG